MFVGHLAVAFVAKKAEPQVPLAALVAASFGLDLLWPVFLVAGMEHVRIAPGATAFTPLAFESYPWSHSLLLTLFWGSIAGVLGGSALRHRPAGMLIGATVASHWVLDFVTHRPDLPLWPGGPLVGLGLWNSIPGTFIVEGGFFLGAIALYCRASDPRDALGSWAFWLLIVFVSLIWLAGPWAPPPPSESAVAAVALAMWIFPAWAASIDRHRPARRVVPSRS